MVKKKTDEILIEDPFARIVIMGDFNDDPLDKSIMQGLLYETEIEQSIGFRFANPMIDIFKKGGNTLVYRDDINLLTKSLFLIIYSGKKRKMEVVFTLEPESTILLILFQKMGNIKATL